MLFGRQGALDSDGLQLSPDSAAGDCYAAPNGRALPRKLVGIAAILLLIVLWAAFVAALAPFVGRWPVLAQAPFYLVMGTSLDRPVEAVGAVDRDGLLSGRLLNPTLKQLY